MNPVDFVLHDLYREAYQSEQLPTMDCQIYFTPPVSQSIKTELPSSLGAVWHGGSHQYRIAEVCSQKVGVQKIS